MQIGLACVFGNRKITQLAAIVEINVVGRCVGGRASEVRFDASCNMLASIGEMPPNDMIGVVS